LLGRGTLQPQYPGLQRSNILFFGICYVFVFVQQQQQQQHHLWLVGALYFCWGWCLWAWKGFGARSGMQATQQVYGVHVLAVGQFQRRCSCCFWLLLVVRVVESGRDVSDVWL
jgi:hypothetical protein